MAGAGAFHVPKCLVQKCRREEARRRERAHNLELQRLLQTLQVSSINTHAGAHNACAGAQQEHRGMS